MKPRKAQLQHRAAMRQKELQRKTELRQGKPLERNTPMPRTGITRKPRPNGPVKTRSESTHIPDPIRDAVLERDGYSCARCGRYLVGTIRYGLQHRKPRKGGGSKLLHTMANLVTLCGWSVDKGTCTAWVEIVDRPQATAEGWLIPDGLITPGEWRVRRLDGAWLQPGDEMTPAVPHPRQIEMGAPVGAEGGTPA